MNTLIRYALSIFAGLLSGVCLFLVGVFPIWWVFAAVIAVWFASLFFLHDFAQKGAQNKIWNLVLLFITLISFIALFSLAEKELPRWIMIIAVGLVIALLLIRSPHPQMAISPLQKPVRRMIMMLWVFDAFSLLTFLFALNIFFSIAPFWVLNILGGSLIAVVSYLVWREY